MSRLLQLLGIIAIAFVQVQSTPEFNCLRTSDDCAGGSSCAPTGECTCTAQKGNYDCGTDTTSVGTACACENTGFICLPDETTCVCSEKFYGPKCQYKTLDVSCSSAGNHILNVNVPGTPTCYVKGFENTCSFTTTPPTGTPTGWTGNFLEASLTDSTNCGPPTATTDTNGTSTQCFTVICRYEALYLTGLDFEATFCCGDAQKTVTTADLSLSENGLTPTNVVADPAGNVVTVVMKDGSDAPITSGSTVDIGSTVKLEFTLDSASDFAAIRVLSCKAKDGGSMEAVFITNSCPAKTFVQSTTRTRTTGSPVTIETRAIRFTSGSTVTYECTVLVCRQMTECTAETCTGGIDGFGRKKREIAPSSNSTEQKTLVTFIRVNDPLATSDVKSAVQDAVAQTGTINLTAAVIGLAVVVLVLLGACLVLGLRLINRRAPVTDTKG
ncbi:EGF-like domain-containing protein 2 [Haliotis rufescens]|uniref:EGF-like domain-containing protein 2 n=1 Tax=Haliotis rufescens TaxID=6454 RepID=UPI00201F1FE2|nr:EGF-like domain-containing protein 2 [Haliotis rufescens]